MRKNALLLPLIAALLASPLPAPAEDGAQTLTGEYVWSQRGSSGDLEAVFTPSGDDTWDVAFHFKFRGKAHTYAGTAHGNLQDGGLEGKVTNENGRRSFTFSGTFEGDTFRGSHAETTGGDEDDTGTLTLQRGG